MESPTLMQDSDGILEIDTLKQFTIPKRKKAKKELFETLTPDSREYLQDILHVIKLSYKDRESVKNFSYSRPRLIHNDQLLNEYTEKKKRMRQDGYMEKELQDINGFFYVETEQEARKICRDGLRTGNSTISCLGNPKMGVYLCKHADILTAEPLKSRQAGMIILFKVIKGKVKFMVENRSGTPLEPSPNYDCHLLKMSNIDMAVASPQYIYECTQLYLYEYMDDAEISDRPRQIYPFAVVDFRFQGISSRDASRLGPPVLQQQMRAQTKKPTTKKPWPVKDVPVPPLLEPLELKKARHKSADVSSSRNPQQISPNMPKVDSRKNGSTVEKDSLSSGGGSPAPVAIRDAVIWSGDLIIDGVPLSAVQLMSYALTFKPSGLRKGINIEKKIPLASIRSQYFESLKSLDQKSEQNVNGSHCFYAYLVPSVADGGRAFKKFVDYLTTSQAGLVINLRDNSQMVVVPDCDITQDLNLNIDGSNAAILHCIIFLKRSMSDELKEITEKCLKLPDQVESKGHVSSDVVLAASADNEKTGNVASATNVPAQGSGEAPVEGDMEQATEPLQSRDPRLRHKLLSQVRAPKAVEVVRDRPLVVSHSRLVTMFDEMSKLQDKSNIELARMMKMSRHVSTSNLLSSQPSSSQPTNAPPRLEQLEVFPRRSPAPLSSPGMPPDRMMPVPQGPPPRPLLGPSDQEGARGGVRMQGPPAEGFQNPWMWRWPGVGPQRGMPNRGPFPGPPSANGMYSGWSQPFSEPLYPPGPEFKAAPARPKEMLSPRAWEELQKKSKGGQETVQRPPELRPAGPPAEFASHPTRRTSDPRNAGRLGDFAGPDSGRYIPDQRYGGGFPGDYAAPDTAAIRQPGDPRSGRHYSSEYNMYDSNRWMAGGLPNEQPGNDGNRRMNDTRIVGPPGEHPGQDVTKWPSDPRQSGGPLGEYSGQDSDWWPGEQRAHTDRLGQNSGWPAADNSRSVGLLGDYPSQDLNQPPRASEPRPGDSGEQPNRNSRSLGDPRVARLGLDPSAGSRWPVDPRTVRPSGTAVASESSGEDSFRNNHSSAVAVTFEGNMPVTGWPRDALEAGTRDVADRGPDAVNE